MATATILILLLSQAAGAAVRVISSDARLDFPRPAIDGAHRVPGRQTDLEPSPGAPIDNSGNVPQDVVAADFNQDGIPDLAIAFAYDDAVRWYYGSEGGTLAFQGEVGVGVHPGTLNDLPRALWAHDFDGDGFVDLAVLCSGNPDLPFPTPPSLGILYGDPIGGFEPFRVIDMASTAAPLPRFSTSLAAGLIDADDHVDLVVGHFDSHQISVIMHKHGRLWKQPRVFPVTTAGSGPAALSMADLNFDGAMDLVVANRGDLQIWQGDGNGGFAQRTTFSSGTAFTATTAADFDRDGLWDIAALDGAQSTMRVYMGLSASGTVSRVWSTSLSPGGGPVDLLTYDADLDGCDDVALIYLLAGGGDIFLGQDSAGTSPLAFRRHFSTARSPRALAAADFDMDGRDDLAIVHEGDQSYPANDDLVLDYNCFSTSGTRYLAPRSSWVPGRQISPYLDRPIGLSWDPVRSALWTMDRKDRQIVCLSSHGAGLERIPINDLGANRLLDPAGIAIGHLGHLWIADRLAGQILQVDPARQYNLVISNFSTTDAGLLRPHAITFDRTAGRLLVSDERTPRIVAFSTAGIALKSYTITGGHLVADMSIDQSSGRLWATLLDLPHQLVRL
ncbi:hypothetical protein AMJ85_11960, partial [candidate division BRC1 bacterium SM23_51]